MQVVSLKLYLSENKHVYVVLIKSN